MPINEKIKEIDFPMEIRFNEEPETQYYNSEVNIMVNTLIHPPPNYKQICYDMIMATWRDHTFHLDPSEKELNKVFNDLLTFKVLPNSMEALTFVFSIHGLTHIEISHLLRHRLFFSIHAQCSGDRFLNHDSVFIPSSIQNSKFCDEYEDITEKAKELYAKMVDSKEISLMDARYILTRNHRYFYYVGMNLKDALSFINQRKCTMVQPELDNILAHNIYYEIAKYIPEILDVSSLECNKSCHFVRSSDERNTRLYQPDENLDKLFEYNPRNFVYMKTRKEMGISNEKEKKSITK